MTMTALPIPSKPPLPNDGFHHALHIPIIDENHETEKRRERIRNIKFEVFKKKKYIYFNFIP